MTLPRPPMRVLIAGMHGFVGTHIAVASKRRGFEVVGLSLESDIEKTRRLHEGLGIGDLPAVAGDATNTECLVQVIEDHAPDVFINAVGNIRSHRSEWVGGYSVNIQTALATVDGVAAVPPERRPFLLWVGSQAEYGLSPSPWTELSREEPASGYGVSKYLATTTVLAARRSGLLDGCVVRLPILFGPAQEPVLFVAAAIASALRGDPFAMTRGDQIRRFAYAPDIGEVFATLAQRTNDAPQLLNAPGYQPVRMKEIAAKLTSLLPDCPPPRIGALPYRAEEQMKAWPDTTLAQSQGFDATTPLDNALKETVLWYRENEWFLED